jgi:hypothetical protein
LAQPALLVGFWSAAIHRRFFVPGGRRMVFRAFSTKNGDESPHSKKT